MALTPMMQQYLQIKEQYPDTLVMFRLGDFYELFFDDAVAASKALEITLTGRDAGSQGRVPMCGVPCHAAEQYIRRLVDQGYRVAICEQLEDPKETKGLVRRDVVRVLTPGTVLTDEGTGRRLLTAVVARQGISALASMDVSTGEVWFVETPVEQWTDVLTRWRPSEILAYGADGVCLHPEIERWCQSESVLLTVRPEPRQSLRWAEEQVCQQYGVPNLVPLDLHDYPVAVEALGLLLQYVDETQKQRLAHIRNPRNLTRQQCMTLDYTAVRNLELVANARTGHRKGSLYGVLDQTRTAMGSRLLRQWLERPLNDVEQIRQRLDAVEALVGDVFVREQLREALSRVYDLDRLAGKVSFGTANARDLKAMAASLGAVPDICALLRGTDSVLLRQIADGFPDFSELAQRIEAWIVDQPPTTVREGGIIRAGVDAELDELRTLNYSAKEWLARFEQSERERTGIKSLRVGFNKVFGYYIEVSKANSHLVPADYERRQTLTNGERYTLPALKEQEARILHAEERSLEREYELFCTLRDSVLERLSDIQRTAEWLAYVDALTAFAHVSVQHGYVRPDITEERGIEIEQGRHPVVEAHQPGTFVPNDTSLGKAHDLVLITGPNMAGKSTYMRQTALIVIMAHLGCFVPAKSARIGLVDRVFTRIGASDDLSGGQSTFMVEMVELAQILRQATGRSLVLLDEIGRGTSTYDGMSIAEAVMEALQVPGRTPLTMFATHYHELTAKADALPRVANCSVLVRETAGGISFLHTVVNRPADKSYGIQVAKLAGIPTSVIARAQELLDGREFASGRQAARETAASGSMDNPTLFEWPCLSLLQRVAEMDVDNMTPIQALNVLNHLAAEAREVLTWEKSV